MKLTALIRNTGRATPRVLGMICTGVVTVALLTSFPALEASAAVKDPSPTFLKPVPGASAPALSTAAAPTSSTTASTPATTLPVGTYTVPLQSGSPKSPLTTQSADGASAAVTSSPWIPIGQTGISLASATPATGGATTDSITPTKTTSAPAPTITATVLDAAAAAKYGYTGLVLQLNRTDNNPTTQPVAVQIPTSLLNGLYGADYASRVHWVQIPTATATPKAKSVASTPDSANTATVLTPMVGSAPTVVAATSGPVSTSGTGAFSATSLKPATTWDVSAQTGDFSWSYPLRTPPAAAGPAPSLSLNYDSQSIDGETGSSNNQPSAIGEGWSLAGSGFIERTYVSCSQDNGASGPVSTSGDLCWKTDNATISLGGHSGQLVKDATSGTWKLQSDDGSRIEHLVGASQGCATNGTYDTDCWRLTTRDGTQYFFGLNQLPGWAAGKAATNSTWTVPVFGNDSGEPCHASTFATSACTQAWRWNLDYVVDIHNNAEALYYDAETNSYAKNGTGATSYTRGGQLDHIDYGLTASTVFSANAASDKVTFGYDPYGRCNASNHSGCTAQSVTGNAISPAQPALYPDVPFDQSCTGSSCPNLVSPTFWTVQMLNTVTTSVLRSGSYANVDAWTLGHSFPAPGDGTNAALWLTQVAHTGYGNGTSLSDPTTTFAGTTMQNRVWVINGLAPLDKWRIASITTSTGAVISVNYSAQQCTPAGAAAIEASPETNTSRCFPQWWTPQVVPAQAPSKDLFHKYVVTSVVSNPETGGGNDRPQETDYVYTGTPAWRYDTSPLTMDSQRTWSVYAGYNTVEIRVGDSATPSTQQTTDYTFYQGMDGDRATSTGGTKSVSVTGASGVADSRWFAGTTREVKVLNGVGGAVISDSIHTPWASAVTANDNTNTARLTGDTESVTTEPLSTGGNRTTDVKTTNGMNYGLPTSIDTITSDAETTCTTLTYNTVNTSAWLVGLPTEVSKVGVDCANLASATFPAAAISDVKTFYDGSTTFSATPSKGDATSTQVVKSYTGTTASTAQWVQASATTYDTMGRPLTATDALSHTTSTVYTPAADAAAGSGALTKTVTTNTAPFNWTATETYDPAWGVETSATDQNNKLTTAAYDALGRRTGVWLPNWPESANPNSPSTGYAYTLSQTTPNAVLTSTITAGTNVLSYALFDGLGRQVQTQAQTEGGGTVVSDQGYDAAGRVSMTNNPYGESSAAASTNLFVPTSEAQIPSETVPIYDGAGRTTATVLNSYGNERYRTTTAYPGADRTDTTPPTGGTPTSLFTNSLGEKTKLVQYLAATISGTATQEATTYGYSAAGQMTSMTDPAGNAWSWGFDVLGNQTSATDPDTGTTTSTYDLAGNTLTTTDSRGVVLAYAYDALNRKTGEYKTSTGTTGSLLATWTYDTLTGAKGQLTSSASYTGSTANHPGIAYTDAITGYDNSYQPTGEKISIPTGAPAFGGLSYTTGMLYYPDGALSEKDYPATAGITAEQLDYGYDGFGKLVGLFGNNDYGNTIFSPIGQVAQLARHGTTSEFTNYGYDAGNGSVTNILDQTITGGTTTTQANRLYSRDNAGNVTSVSTTGTAATDTQCYTYDYQQNLTQVWTPAANACSSAPTTTDLGGPAPYWTSYTIDAATGNRTNATKHSVSGVSPAAISNYTYPVAAAAHPHAVQTVTTGSTTNTYGYDTAGETTTRPGQTLTYNEIGKIATVTAGTSTQTDVYDASGTLLLQKDPTAGATLFLGDTQVHLAPGATSASVVRTYSMNGHPVVERTAAAGATTSAYNWLTTDIDGTADLEVSPTTGTVTRRYQDPYGNVRGTPVAWSSQNGFLNAPTSTFSSLTQVGARAYDPLIGKFLTVDSLLLRLNPQQMNGYSYSSNSPITFSDPSGNCLTSGDYLTHSSHCAGGNQITSQAAGAKYSPPAPGLATTVWKRPRTSTAPASFAVPSFQSPTAPAIPWSGLGTLAGGVSKALGFFGSIGLVLSLSGDSTGVGNPAQVPKSVAAVQPSAPYCIGSVFLCGAMLNESDSSSGDSATAGDPPDRALDAKPNFEDPSISPGEGWEWKGTGDPRSGKGAYTRGDDPKVDKESLHPDLDHGDPFGPHYDWKTPGGTYRVYPDGSIVRK